MILWILLVFVVILFYIGLDYRLKLYTVYNTTWWAKQIFCVIKSFFVCVITGCKIVLRWMRLYKGDI